jgi:hypothetical protein
MARMPLFAIADIPFFCVIPLEAIDLSRKLAVFQRNLRSKDWPSLSAIYPRMGMWTYALCLFSWGEYCGQLQTILANPDRSLAAEMFLRHICQIDSYVDSFHSRNVWLTDPGHIKMLPEVSLTSRELCRHLGEYLPATQVRNPVVKLINEYRRNALTAMQDWANSPESLDCVLRVKSETAGMLWYCWSTILGHMYDVAPAVVSNASATFFNYGLLVQIVDDLADTPSDYRVKTQNMFIAIVRETPAEWETLRKHLIEFRPRFLGWPWVKDHLPVSYGITSDFYGQFADQLLRDSHAPSIAKKLYGSVDKVKRMST